MTRCTIITPCFNDGVYLGALRESLRRGEPVEHIIVDDGSTDEETLRILEELAEEPDVTIVHVENGGPGAARNLAIGMVDTPYTMPADADDIVLPGAIRDLADALDADPDLGVVWGDTLLFGAELQYQQRIDDLDPWWFTWLNDVAVCLMGRTEVLAAAGWDTTSMYEDWGTTLALTRAGVAGRNIGRATYGYRTHGTERRLGSARGRDEAELANLRSRYAEVFDARPQNRARTSVPRQVSTVTRIVDAVPGLGLSRRREVVSRLATNVWPLRWMHHPGALPRQPLTRRLLGPPSEHHVGRLESGIAAVAPGVSDVVVVSPHFDDSVLSAFALLDDQAVAATVLNVFTADQPDDWAGRTAGADGARRGREDERAIGDRASRVDLGAEADIGDDELVRRIGDAIETVAAAATGATVVAVPAGAGLTEPAGRLGRIGPIARLLGTWTSPRHDQHVRAADAVRTWAAATDAAVTVVAYDEMPYHWARSGLGGHDPSTVFHLAVDASAKAEAVGAYESQLPSLFTAAQLEALPRWLPAVETYAVERRPATADA